MTTYQDIKLSSLEVEDKKLPHFFFTRNEAMMNFESKITYFFYMFKKKILYKIQKTFFVPYEFYKNETTDNIQFLQTAAAVIQNANISNNYNSVPSSAVSNEIFDIKINKNIKNKILSQKNRDRNSEDDRDKNLNINFPCNQIKELITNNYNYNTHSNSLSNSENNTNNNKKSLNGNNINTKSVSLSKSNSRSRTIINNEDNVRNINAYEIKNRVEDQNNNFENIDIIKNYSRNDYYRVSKNMQKRMNQYLLNHNILNIENIFRDQNSWKKDRNTGSVHTLNRQTYSFYYSGNVNENNINLGEIHLSEREKNNLNHVFNEFKITNKKNKRNVLNNENYFMDEKNHNYSVIKKSEYKQENSHLNKNKMVQDIDIYNNSDKLDKYSGNSDINKKFNDFDKNKKIPRHFKINSNLDSLNQKHLKDVSRDTGRSNKNNIENENIIDSNRRTLLDNSNSKDILPSIFKDRNNYNQINLENNEKNINELANESKKSLSEKIISIINSSGTVDDLDLSENGNY